MLKVFILFGPPAAGKGSISKQIPDENVISMGNLIRQKGINTQSGSLVSDEYVNQILLEELKQKKAYDYVLLDGYPRTKEQAVFLKNIDFVNVEKLYCLEIDDKEVLYRICRRQSCSCGCSYHPELKPSKIENICDLCGNELFVRSDDNPESIKKRLSIYHEQKGQILPEFKECIQYIDVQDSNFKKSINDTVAEILKPTSKGKNIGILKKKIEDTRIH